MKDYNKGLCQVVTPGIIFSLTDMVFGNATKTAQELCSLPRQRTSQGPCSEPLLWLPAQVRISSWELSDSADATIKPGRDFSFSEISAGCLVKHHPQHCTAYGNLFSVSQSHLYITNFFFPEDKTKVIIICCEKL